MGEQDNNTALFGECKWRQELVDAGVLETLVKRSRLFHYSRVELYLFAKTGFTQGCREMAETLDHVSLISFTEMMELFREPQV